MSPDKMVHQANQIAKFFETQHGGEAVERTAQHLNDFWEPRMRTQPRVPRGYGPVAVANSVTRLRRSRDLVW